jgi:hypothetical protein
LGNLINLPFISLANNYLTGTIPNSFVNLTNLRDVRFAHNRLSREHPWRPVCDPKTMNLNLENETS